MLPICSTQPARCSGSYPAFLEGKSSPFVETISPSHKAGVKARVRKGANSLQSLNFLQQKAEKGQPGSNKPLWGFSSCSCSEGVTTPSSSSPSSSSLPCQLQGLQESTNPSACTPSSLPSCSAGVRCAGKVRDGEKGWDVPAPAPGEGQPAGGQGVGNATHSHFQNIQIRFYKSSISSFRDFSVRSRMSQQCKVLINPPAWGGFNPLK